MPWWIRASQGDVQSHSLERRSLLPWLGAASLILPTALTACANSILPRQYKRSPSHVTGKDHRNGGSLSPIRMASRSTRRFEVCAIGSAAGTASTDRRSTSGWRRGSNDGGRSGNEKNSVGRQNPVSWRRASSRRPAISMETVPPSFRVARTACRMPNVNATTVRLEDRHFWWRSGHRQGLPGCARAGCANGPERIGFGLVGTRSCWPSMGESNVRFFASGW